MGTCPVCPLVKTALGALLCYTGSCATMADWRVVCVAVCLVVAAVAAQSTEDRSETELEGLLSAMKRYLHAEKDDDDVSSRQSAHDDVRTVYDPCMTSELVRFYFIEKFTVEHAIQCSRKRNWNDNSHNPVRYQGNALTDAFNANRVQCLTLLVHTSRPLQTVNTIASAKFRNKSLKHTNYKNKQKIIVNTQTCKRRWLWLSYYWIRSNVKIGTHLHTIRYEMLF